MQLFLSQPFSWPLLLLLLSNLVLWGNVASEPMCHNIDGRCVFFLEELFEHALLKSQTSYDMTSAMYNQFFTSDFSSKMFHEFSKKYVQHDALVVQAFSSCDTAFVDAPIIKGETKQIQPLDLLKMTLNLVGSWNWPLNYLLIKLSDMQGAPAALLSRVKEIKENREELLDDLHRLLRKVYPEVQANEDYPVWPEFASLQELEENSRFLAVYKVAHCINLETYKTFVALKVLECKILYKNNCPRDGS